MQTRAASPLAWAVCLNLCVLAVVCGASGVNRAAAEAGVSMEYGGGEYGGAGGAGGGAGGGGGGGGVDVSTTSSFLGSLFESVGNGIDVELQDLQAQHAEDLRYCEEETKRLMNVGDQVRDAKEQAEKRLAVAQETNDVAAAEKKRLDAKVQELEDAKTDLADALKAKVDKIREENKELFDQHNDKDKLNEALNKLAVATESHGSSAFTAHAQMAIREIQKDLRADQAELKQELAAVLELIASTHKEYAQKIQDKDTELADLQKLLGQAAEDAAAAANGLADAKLVVKARQDEFSTASSNMVKVQQECKDLKAAFNAQSGTFEAEKNQLRNLGQRIPQDLPEIPLAVRTKVSQLLKTHGHAPLVKHKALDLQPVMPTETTTNTSSTSDDEDAYQGNVVDGDADDGDDADDDDVEKDLVKDPDARKDEELPKIKLAPPPKQAAEEQGWWSEDDACPDDWKRVRYNATEGKLYCQSPSSASSGKPASADCRNTTVAFGEETPNRCEWSRKCGASWSTYGCYPYKWTVQANSCPNGWLNGGYSFEDKTLTCIPTSKQWPYNDKCNHTWTFEEDEDRCAWSKKCQVVWSGVDCWKAPPHSGLSVPNVTMWYEQKQACPTGWKALGYNSTTKELLCDPSTAPQPPANPECRGKVAAFKSPEQQDRCSWQLKCGVWWGPKGCYPPRWSRHQLSCPNHWKRAGYDWASKTLTCVPQEKNPPGNEECNVAAKFTEPTDEEKDRDNEKGRCAWSERCKVKWDGVGCWNPEDDTDSDAPEGN